MFDFKELFVYSCISSCLLLSEWLVGVLEWLLLVVSFFPWLAHLHLDTLDSVLDLPFAFDIPFPPNSRFLLVYFRNESIPNKPVPVPAS